jgi:hypothetical protein
MAHKTTIQNAAVRVLSFFVITAIRQPVYVIRDLLFSSQ